jgi:hypothetical protein
VEARPAAIPNHIKQKKNVCLRSHVKKIYGRSALIFFFFTIGKRSLLL